VNRLFRRRALGSHTSVGAGILDVYSSEQPSPQQTVDIFAGEWSSKFPASLGVTAGNADLFADGRLAWLMEQATNLDNKHVLELGPLEGGHSFQLAQAGARVTAVEGNTHAFLKCLITKELLGMSDCSFLLGDFTRYLEAHQDEQFDVVLASGVLYHSTDPLHLLKLISGVSNTVMMWTHYYDADAIHDEPAVAKHFRADPQPAMFRQQEILLHRRDYLESLEWQGFCGGPAPYAYWLEREDLLGVLSALGYTDVRVGGDHPRGVNGPSILLYASRGSAEKFAETAG
jgi:Methyltransferase domain